MSNEKQVELIINMLCDRGGFDDWWSNLDEDIQNDIKQEIIYIIN